MQTINRSILNKIYKKRQPWVHKGDFGRLLVIAGSERHTGSPIFVSLAAYRAGCDLVFLVGPRRSMDIAASYSPEFITEPLDGTQLEGKHVKKILTMVKELKPTAIVIGPGLRRTPETRKSIVRLIRQIKLPMVIDADAIRAVSAVKEILYKKNVVLTPHQDEFREFYGMKVTTNLKERIKAVKEEAYKINSFGDNRSMIPSVVILLKGHLDIITNGTKVVLNKTGSPKQTVGGMGDTLAGICGAMLARCTDTFTAGCAAAYVNGKAGVYAIKKYGESTITTDLIEEIHTVLGEIIKY